LTPKLKAPDRAEAEAKTKVRQFTKELTKRQRDIVRLIAEGRRQKEVASILNLSVKTVAYHKHQVMRAFNIKSNADLVLFALDRGLISHDSSPKLSANPPG
jgi:DNA-binding NarL/FixJ family response regulator